MTALNEKLGAYFLKQANELEFNDKLPSIISDSAPDALRFLYGLCTGTSFEGNGIDRRLKKTWEAAVKAEAIHKFGEAYTPSDIPADMQNFMMAFGTTAHEISDMDKRMKAHFDMLEKADEWMKTGDSRYNAQMRVIRMTLTSHLTLSGA